ncbi:MAG: hypothetical protein NTY65_15470 [Planctomycetota bacterium]|nr:hypothetical protein [Planctomycetota bacterium]
MDESEKEAVKPEPKRAVSAEELARRAILGMAQARPAETGARETASREAPPPSKPVAPDLNAASPPASGDDRVAMTRAQALALLFLGLATGALGVGLGLVIILDTHAYKPPMFFLVAVANVAAIGLLAPVIRRTRRCAYFAAMLLRIVGYVSIIVAFVGFYWAASGHRGEALPMLGILVGFGGLFLAIARGYAKGGFQSPVDISGCAGGVARRPPDPEIQHGPPHGR